MIARKLLMGMLLVGAVSGYASGFRSLACWRKHHQMQRQAVMHEVARTCAQAAVQADREARAGGNDLGSQRGPAAR